MAWRVLLAVWAHEKGGAWKSWRVAWKRVHALRDTPHSWIFISVPRRWAKEEHSCRCHHHHPLPPPPVTLPSCTAAIAAHFCDVVSVLEVEWRPPRPSWRQDLPLCRHREVIRWQCHDQLGGDGGEWRWGIDWRGGRCFVNRGNVGGRRHVGGGGEDAKVELEMWRHVQDQPSWVLTNRSMWH